MRVVNIGLAPVVNDREGDVHHLVNPSAAALIQPKSPEIGAENHLDGVHVTRERLFTGRARMDGTARDGIARTAIRNAIDSEDNRIDIGLRGL